MYTLRMHTGRCIVLLLIFPFSFLLNSASSDGFVIHQHHHCYLPMTQQAVPRHNLRHRSQAKAKRNDDNDDDDATNDGNDMGKLSQSHNSGNATGGEGSSNQLKTPQTRTNHHRHYSNNIIETNLMNKRTKQLQQENNQLRKTIHDLQSDHRKLLLQLQAKQQKQSPPPSNKVVLERFEGERRPHPHRHATPTGDDVEYGSNRSNINKNKRNSTNRYYNNNNNNENQEAEDRSLLWCDVPNTEDGTCPIEPDIHFTAALRDRAIWLVSLLVLQSISGIILYRNELVLSNHPSIIYFLTMLVGAGGNAGNQASVRVIRGIAVGALSPNNYAAQRQFLFRELKMAFGLSIIVAIVGFMRTILFHSVTPLSEAIAITVALYLIVLTSVCLGAVLPFILQRLRIDPAHSSTSIQVIMDILGVYLTVAVTSLLLDSPFGKVLISRWT